MDADEQQFNSCPYLCLSANIRGHPMLCRPYFVQASAVGVRTAQHTTRVGGNGLSCFRLNMANAAEVTGQQTELISTDPATGAEVGRVRISTPDEVRAAVGRSREVFHM